MFPLFLSLLLLTSAAAVAGDGVWEDTDFLARFTASYGVRGEQEPQVTREEQALLREVATQMPENVAEAAAILARGLRPSSSAALDFTLGNLRFQLGDLAEAGGHYRAAIRKFPDFLRAHKNLGLTLARQEEYQAAVASLSRALTLGSVDGDTYGLIGFSHLYLGNWVSAEAAYRQGLLFESDNPNWQIGLARALQAQDRHGEAGALLGEMTSRWPDRLDFWVHQANTHLATNEPMKAAANLEWVRRLGGGNQQSLLLLADIYVNEGLAPLGLGVWEQVFQSGEGIPLDRLVRTAERLGHQGYWEETSQLLGQLQRNPPEGLSGREEGQILRLRAMVAVAESRTDEGRDLLEQALERNPLDGEALLQLAAILVGEDLEQAEVLLSQAARIPDLAVRALLQHGEMLVRAGNYPAALIPLREAEMLGSRTGLRRYIEQIERLVEVD
jgi:tetratricopeptide (TPR) repeat protein